MNAVDLIIVGFAFVMAVWGWRQGLIVGGLSLVGFVAGALAGSRLGPLVLDEGSRSPYAPLVTLAAALVVGAILAALGERIGSEVRRRVGMNPVDGIGGALLLAAVGLLLAWIAGAAALQTPGLKSIRPDVQRSELLGFLNKRLPPSGPILNALARFDPVPTLDGPSPNVPKPPPGIARAPAVQGSRASVVRVLGTACGLNIQGSGWIAQDGLVVTNAHVVAGEDESEVQIGGEGTLHKAQAILFDPRNDLAVLRAPGVSGAPALPIDSDPEPGVAAAIVGFPQNGDFTAEPGRIGETTEVVSQDAYGRGPVKRQVTLVRGQVIEGNSGGPMIDKRGRVVTTVFAAAERSGSGSGFGVPSGIAATAVRDADPTRVVSTGPCTK